MRACERAARPAALPESAPAKVTDSLSSLPPACDIPAQPRRRPNIEPEPRDAWAEAYRFGWHAGRADGLDQAAADTDRLWLGALGLIQTVSPTSAELHRRRAEDPKNPCPTRCRKCSRCVRSMAYWSRGGRDYLGVEQERAVSQ